MSNENIHEPDYSRLRFLDYVGVRVPNGPPVRMMIFEGNYLVTEEEGTIEAMLATRLKARKVSDAKYEDILAQYKQQKFLERQGSTSAEPAPPDEEEKVYATPSPAPIVTPKVKSVVQKDGTYAEQRPDRPKALVQRDLSEENDKALGDVIDTISQNTGRRTIPVINNAELKGRAPAAAPTQKSKTPPARPEHEPKAPEAPVLESGERKSLNGPVFSPSPKREETLPYDNQESKIASNVIGAGFPEKSDVDKPDVRGTPRKPPAPPTPPPPPARSVTSNKGSAQAKKPARSTKPVEEKKQHDATPEQVPGRDETVVYDSGTDIAHSPEPKKDKSFAVVTGLVSVTIVALLIVATLLLFNSSGILGRDVNEYNVVVLTGEVTAGQTITEAHISNVLLNKDEYNTLTANTFEITQGGEVVKEVPVPYERREEVIGLIAKDNYAAGTIITNRMVSDQRTITNQFFNVVGQTGSQRLEVTIDSETGMTTVKLYAIAPNESGEGVAILLGEATLTDKELTALLNGDTDVLLHKLFLSGAQEGTGETEETTDIGDGGDVGGASDDEPGTSSEGAGAEDGNGGETDG